MDLFPSQQQQQQQQQQTSYPLRSPPLPQHRNQPLVLGTGAALPPPPSYDSTVVVAGTPPSTIMMKSSNHFPDGATAAAGGGPPTVGKSMSLLSRSPQLGGGEFNPNAPAFNPAIGTAFAGVSKSLAFTTGSSSSPLAGSSADIMSLNANNNSNNHSGHDLYGGSTTSPSLSAQSNDASVFSSQGSHGNYNNNNSSSCGSSAMLLMQQQQQQQQQQPGYAAAAALCYGGCNNNGTNPHNGGGGNHPLLLGGEPRMHIWVVDPMTRRLKVPIHVVHATQATSHSGSVPSLCIPFLEGKCRLGIRCRQAHVPLDVVSQLREETLRIPSCCSAHGSPLDVDGLTSRFAVVAVATAPAQQVPSGHAYPGETGDDIILNFNAEGKSSIKGNFLLVPSAHVARTVGLLRFLVQDVPPPPPAALNNNNSNNNNNNNNGAAIATAPPSPSSSSSPQVVEVPLRQVCRLHLQSRCRFLEDCGNLHICRELGAHIFASSSLSPHGNNDGSRASTPPMAPLPQYQPPQQQQQGNNGRSAPNSNLNHMINSNQQQQQQQYGSSNGRPAVHHEQMQPNRPPPRYGEVSPLCFGSNEDQQQQQHQQMANSSFSLPAAAVGSSSSLSMDGPKYNSTPNLAAVSPASLSVKTVIQSYNSGAAHFSHHHNHHNHHNHQHNDGSALMTSPTAPAATTATAASGIVFKESDLEKLRSIKPHATHSVLGNELFASVSGSVSPASVGGSGSAANTVASADGESPTCNGGSGVVCAVATKRVGHVSDEELSSIISAAAATNQPFTVVDFCNNGIPLPAPRRNGGAASGVAGSLPPPPSISPSGGTAGNNHSVSSSSAAPTANNITTTPSSSSTTFTAISTTMMCKSPHHRATGSAPGAGLALPLPASQRSPAAAVGRSFNVSVSSSSSSSHVGSPTRTMTPPIAGPPPPQYNQMHLQLLHQQQQQQQQQQQYMMQSPLLFASSLTVPPCSPIVAPSAHPTTGCTNNNINNNNNNTSLPIMCQHYYHNGLLGASSGGGTPVHFDLIGDTGGSLLLGGVHSVSGAGGVAACGMSMTGAGAASSAAAGGPGCGFMLCGNAQNLSPTLTISPSSVSAACKQQVLLQVPPARERSSSLLVNDEEEQNANKMLEEITRALSAGRSD